MLTRTRKYTFNLHGVQFILEVHWKPDVWIVYRCGNRTCRHIEYSGGISFVSIDGLTGSLPLIVLIYCSLALRQAMGWRENRMVGLEG